jgi:hypothetical protein
MHSFSTAAALLPVARYNVSYAAALAQYGLCVAASSRLFFRAYNTPAQVRIRRGVRVCVRRGARAACRARGFGARKRGLEQVG